MPSLVIDEQSTAKSMKAQFTTTFEDLYQLAGYPSQLNLGESDHTQPYRLPVSLDTSINSGYSCIFDWSRMQYLFMSASVMNVLGYHHDVFLTKGLTFMLRLIHPSDIQRLQQLHHTIFSFFYNTPVHKRSNLRFSYILRIKTTGNTYVDILRQSVFTEFTADGKPIIEYINSMDISGFKCPSMNLNIHRRSDGDIYTLCHEQNFPEHYPWFTERENEVFHLVKRGYTTKEIALKLHLSIETIKSHRKNILAKTGASNMVSAIGTIPKKHE